MTDPRDVIIQNGIVKILEQKGYHKDTDFMFVDMNSETDLQFDGVPMYRIAEYQNDKTNVYSEKLKKDVTLEIISSANMYNGNWGQTSSNNGVYAVYVHKQGFIFTTNPEIKQLMEQEFKFQDTHFGIPLSNGAQFRDDKLQSIWKQILLNDGIKKVKQKTNTLNPNTVNAINNQGMDK